MTTIKKKFDAKIGKVLQLMVHSIYTNRSIFLRELISNASDALDKVRYYSMENHELLSETLEIKISINQDKKLITIEDNGIGMDAHDLEANLGTIANSGTQDLIDSASNKNLTQLIGRFGVGFYSSFMVADKVTIYSTKIGSNKTYIWESEGIEDYEIRESQELLHRGTRIELKIKSSDVEFIEKYRLKHIISIYSDYIGFPIILTDEEGNSEKVNKGEALWMRPKSEITENEYDEFYHYISHTPDKPLIVMHNKVEGSLDYISLLYIPGEKPFDLFHPDRRRQVKLYIKRVFIAEDEIDLLPRYLRFVKGIVDSEDLPLNISRETLQSNVKVARIKNALMKKIISTLKTKSEQEPETYRKFWKMFGEVIKEGLCEPQEGEKEDLLNICLFHSIKHKNELISLEQYVSEMLKEQKQIYYLTGNNIDVMMNNPQLEGFVKRGIDVLLLNDNVDDFWLTVVYQYKDRELKSVADANLNLDEIVNLPKEEKDSKDEDVETKIKKEHEMLISYIKFILGDSISNVYISSKLVNSPACLSIPEGSMNIKMEQMMIEQKQLKKRKAKILEINTNHPILLRVMKFLKSKSEYIKNEEEGKFDFSEIKCDLKEQELIKNLINVIFTEACMTAGEVIDDPYKAASVIDHLIVSVL